MIQVNSDAVFIAVAGRHDDGRALPVSVIENRIDDRDKRRCESKLRDGTGITPIEISAETQVDDIEALVRSV